MQKAEHIKNCWGPQVQLLAQQADNDADGMLNDQRNTTLTLQC